MPRTYGYGRVSTDRQENSENAQRQMIIDAAARKCQANQIPPLENPETDIYIDVDEKRGTIITERPAGRELFVRLQSGDHLIVCKHDRVGKLYSIVHAIEFLKQRGVILHVLNLYGIEMSTNHWMSAAITAIMAGIAEADYEQRRERIADARAWRRSVGLPVGAVPIYGKSIEYFVNERGHKDRRYVDNPEEQRFLNWLVKSRRDGVGWDTMVEQSKVLGFRNRAGNCFHKRDLQGYFRDWKRRAKEKRELAERLTAKA